MLMAVIIGIRCFESDTIHLATPTVRVALTPEGKHHVKITTDRTKLVRNFPT
jgi:hypothetical protein